MKNVEDAEEAKRAALAQDIKKMEESWVMQLQIMALRARIAKAKYDALVKAGFEPAQALKICALAFDL